MVPGFVDEHDHKAPPSPAVNPAYGALNVGPPFEVRTNPIGS
jgi:hypothetical protein